MASNSISWERFTGFPSNIGGSGSTRQELDAAGSPDLDPRLSPLASPRRTEGLLGISQKGSDSTRLGNEQLAPNPSESFRPSWVTTGSAVTKLSGNVMTGLHQAVDRVKDPEIRNRMKDSLGRMTPFSQVIGRMTYDARLVSERRLSVSKG